MKKIALLLLTFLLLISCSEMTVDETNDEDTEVKADENDEEVVSTETESTDVDGSLTAHFIDVGQGDATLLQAVEDGETFNLLIDAGNWTGEEVVPYLLAQSVESLDLVVGTHIHADHIGQLDDVVNEFPVDEVWMTGNVHTTNVFEGVVEAIEGSGASLYEPRSGEEFEIGPLQLDVYHPSELSGDFNDDSISVRVTYGDVSFLFTGDAEVGAEDDMLKAGFDLNADIFQLGHHGSSTSNSPDFVDAVNPEVAIYSAGADNDYGHPHYEIVQLMNDLEIDMLGTDVHGTIVFETDGESYSVNPAREGTVETEKPDFLDDEDEKSVAPGGECIDINSASEEALYEIVHIGEVRAAELIELRPHNTLNGLTRIYGIGDGRIADIKEEGIACVEN